MKISCSYFKTFSRPQRQTQGLRAGVVDDVEFIIQGLRDEHSVADCALKTLELCGNKIKRLALKQVRSDGMADSPTLNLRIP